MFKIKLNIYDRACWENSYQLLALTIFGKRSIIDVWQGSEYDSENSWLYDFAQTK